MCVRWEQEGDDSKSIFLGDVVQGEYLSKKTGVGINESNIYNIRLDDGQVVSVWGATVLDSCFEEGDSGKEIPVGSIVRITCLGKKQGKAGPSKQAGKGYWAFDVQFAIPSPVFKNVSQGAALAEGGRKAETENKAPFEDGESAGY